jgi:hypothetical protein
MTGGARADFAGRCVTWQAPDATGVRVQSDGMQTQAALQSAVGAQDGTLWYCLPEGTLNVGVAPGERDLATVNAAIDAALESQLGAAETSWFRPHVVVQNVPYSKAQLAEATRDIAPRAPNPIAWMVGPTVVDYPVVQITLNATRTSADVAAAEQIVAQYGGMVTLTLTDLGPVSAATDIGMAPLDVPFAVVPLRVTRVLYRARTRRVRVTLVADAGPLHDVVVAAVVAPHRRLGRAALAHLRATSTLTLQLRPTRRRHLTIEVRARTAGGQAILVRRVI